MVYTFRMITGEDKLFLRDYEVGSHSTFLEFHHHILQDLEYDPQQMASFFLANEHWEKGLELTPVDMGEEVGAAAMPMAAVTLGELLKRPKDRLLYVFDVLTDRAFFLELMRISEPAAGKTYPRCAHSMGVPPPQLLFDSHEGQPDPFQDDDSFDEIRNDIGFDDEELPDDPSQDSKY